MSYYKRLIEDKILEYWNSKEALFILGARQVGKTTLIKHLLQPLPSNQKLYLDLENPKYLSIFNKGVDEFLLFIESQGLSKNEKKYIFIDEIQYMDDFSGIIKYMVDHYSDRYKLILSGSSSIQIKHKFKDSLVGRKIIFELFPLSFSEFCRFNDENIIADKLDIIDIFTIFEDPFRFESEKMNHLLKTYLLYGGFPGVALQDDIHKKKNILQDIVQSYILKDIRNLFHLEKTSNFNHLVQLLAIFVGKDLNYSQLANETKLNVQTMTNYIDALEAGYIVRQLQPFHRNLASELRKTPKCYFLDSGVRNQLINSFNEVDVRPDRGELLENFVFTQLYYTYYSIAKINFWRTKQKQEVDFIIQKDSNLLALEVKWNHSGKSNVNIFKKHYPDATTCIVSMYQEFAAGGTRLVPAYVV